MRGRCVRGATERGQVTILMVGVLVVFALLLVGIGRYGEAVTHRLRARTAADAIALATVGDPSAGSELARWYETEQISHVNRDPATVVRSGPAAAAAWAAGGTNAPDSAPALRAIVARAEQLRGERLRSVIWGDIWIEVTAEQATILSPVATELGLCETWVGARRSGRRRFELC